VIRAIWTARLVIGVTSVMVVMSVTFAICHSM
jgi:hypothetical protein